MMQDDGGREVWAVIEDDAALWFVLATRRVPSEKNVGDPEVVKS